MGRGGLRPWGRGSETVGAGGLRLWEMGRRPWGEGWPETVGEEGWSKTVGGGVV